MMDTAELTHLDESIMADECKCEVKHRETVCSYQVTHYYQDCEASELICWNAARHRMSTVEYTNRDLFDCAACHRPAEDCWIIRPV